MSTLELHNPAFAAYCATASVLVLKMAAMSWLTIYRLMKTHSGFRSPEDARAGAFNPEPREGQLDATEYVDRIRRIHQNDLENLLPFLCIGLVYVATGPSVTLAQTLFATYLVARLVHFYVYLTAQSHEMRGSIWTVSSLVMLFMAGSSLWSSMRALGLS